MRLTRYVSTRPSRSGRSNRCDTDADIGDRAAEINLKDEYPLRITKVSAFGGIMTKHDRMHRPRVTFTVDPSAFLPCAPAGATHKSAAPMALAANPIHSQAFAPGGIS